MQLWGCLWIISISLPWQHNASTWTIQAFQDWALSLPGLRGQLRAGGCGSIVEVLQVLKEGGGEELQPRILFQQLEGGSVQVLEYTPGQCKHIVTDRIPYCHCKNCMYIYNKLDTTHTTFQEPDVKMWNYVRKTKGEKLPVPYLPTVIKYGSSQSNYKNCILQINTFFRYLKNAFTVLIFSSWGVPTVLLLWTTNY